MVEKMFINIFSKEAYGEVFVRPDVCHDPPRAFVGMQHDRFSDTECCRTWNWFMQVTEISGYVEHF